MKKKILTLLITVLFTVIVYSQNYWTSEIDINFLVQSNTKVASFVDHNGVHIVYSRNGGIRYALVNSNGGIIKYDKVIESEGAGTNYANVVAFDNYVYAVYYKNNDIKVARSTNLGDSWNNTFAYYDLINTGCNKILTYNYQSDIHIVWSEVRVSGWGYDSHYIKFTPSSQSWSEYKNVTDNETYGGDEPDITFSSNRIHVSFIKYQFDEPKTRDRYAGTWQTSQSVPFDYLPFTTNLRKGKPIIANGLLNEIYRADFASIGTEGSYIGHSYRSLSNSTWYQNDENLFTPVDKIHVVNNTVNNRIHIIYYNELASNYVHKYLTGTTYSNVVANVPLFEQSSFLSASSNDLYLLRVNNPDTPGKIKFRHYDDAPAAPQNLTSFLDPDPSCNNCHGSGPGIRLDWTKNNEPDLSYYTIYRSEQTGCNSCHGSGSSSPPDSSSAVTEPVTVSKECPALQGEITDFSSSKVEVETGCLSGLKSTQKIIFEPIWAWSQNYWVDKNIQEDYTYLYFVTAKDVTSHESGQSNITSTYVPVGSFSKIFSNFSGEVIPKIYLLYQNYPNPFNPVTTIRYQVPEDVHVTLEVFNFLGQKVRTLVNEFKAEGYYSVVWDSKDDYNQTLPSGIYYYRLTTDKFTATKKLVLLK